MEICRIPEILDIESLKGPDNWKRWLQSYEIYENARELDTKTEKVQVAIFLNTIGQNAVDIFNSFDSHEIEVEINKKKVNVEAKTNLQWIKDRFEQYFIPKRNLTYERYIFNTRAQKDNESIDKYYTELKKLAKTCEFGELKDSLIKDRIIIGMKDTALRRRFLQDTSEKEVTSDKLVQAIKIKEISQDQMEVITHKEENINYVQDRSKKNY